MSRTRILIMGAAGRDFHDFNTVFRKDESVEVVAFTATQIPNIDDRRYPPELAGPLYPTGIPIHPESELEQLIRDFDVCQVIFAYSDISYETLLHKAARVQAAGADFRLLGTRRTQLKSNKPLISICAVRTGCGKSQTTRHVAEILKRLGLKVAVIRHPMPYGDLASQAVQRFAQHADLDRHKCTIEEREEYEPHLDRGTPVFAGVDYEQILRQAEKEADVILWDGGNNDLSFYRSDLHVVVVDPHRPGHESRYYPGETNLRLADVVVINKIDTADPAKVLAVRNAVQTLNPEATIVEAASPLDVEQPEAIRGKRVLVIEDGPTLTHGEMPYGAAWVAAHRFGAAEVVDPRPYAVGSIAETYRKYPSTGDVLPAMGYGVTQIHELEETIRKVPCDLVLIGTPIDLRRVIKLEKPAQRVRYDLQEIGKPNLKDILRDRFAKAPLHAVGS